MKKSVLFLLILCLLTGCSGKTDHPTTTPPVEKSHYDFEENPLDSGSGWYGNFPSGLRPVLLVNGTLYRYGGDSNRSLGAYNNGAGQPAGQDWAAYSGDTFLPGGFTAVGEISGITEEVPTEELQLRAAFSATGTVYTNPAIPEAVYALITTETIGPSYWRFVSDALGDYERISYGGRCYRFRAGVNDLCPRITELPEGCVLIGKLDFIGYDLVPQNDLETNIPCDGYGDFLDGREIYASPGDDSNLYLYERDRWSKGEYPSWRVCPLWNAE